MTNIMVMDFWLWQFLGRLHPLIVHFPIGLLIISLVLELFTINKKNQELRSAINILLVIGALSAIAAVIFGWLLKSQDQYSGDLITIHLWSGIATALFALATAALHRLVVTANKTGLLKAYRTMLAFTVLSVTVAGHYGAALTHGSDFLTSVLPWNNASGGSNFDVTRFSKGGTVQVLQAKQIADLNLEVRSIFAHNCYKCHSSEKIKGEGLGKLI